MSRLSLHHLYPGHRFKVTLAQMLTSKRHSVSRKDCIVTLEIVGRLRGKISTLVKMMFKYSNTLHICAPFPWLNTQKDTDIYFTGSKMYNDIVCPCLQNANLVTGTDKFSILLIFLPL